jgi:hypothetical protein
MSRVVVFKSSVLSLEELKKTQPINTTVKSQPALASQLDSNTNNNNLIRRITFPYVATVSPTFALLKQKLGGIHGYKNTAIFYKDEDGDLIAMDTDR